MKIYVVIQVLMIITIKLKQVTMCKIGSTWLKTGKYILDRYIKILFEHYNKNKIVGLLGITMALFLNRRMVQIDLTPSPLIQFLI